MVDFHSHILPGIDDGSRSVEMSVAMLEEMARQGIDCVVATPHFYPHKDRPERFLERREKAAIALQQAIADRTDLPRILLGAEVYYFPGISNSEALPALTIQGTDCILIEMPHTAWTEDMYRELENIRIRHDLLPVIAHIDRYITPLRQHKIPERLSQMDVLIQANGSFFLRPGTRRLAMKLLRADRIHLLGSDCHNMQERAPNLAQAAQVIRQTLGDAPLDRIDRCANEILEN